MRKSGKRIPRSSYPDAESSEDCEGSGCRVRICILGGYYAGNGPRGGTRKDVVNEPEPSAGAARHWVGYQIVWLLASKKNVIDSYLFGATSYAMRLLQGTLGLPVYSIYTVYVKGGLGL